MAGVGLIPFRSVIALSRRPSSCFETQRLHELPRLHCRSSARTGSACSAMSMWIGMRRAKQQPPRVSSGRLVDVKPVRFRN